MNEQEVENQPKPEVKPLSRRTLAAEERTLDFVLRQALYRTWPDILGTGETLRKEEPCDLECDSGWAPLIDALCAVVEGHVQEGAHSIFPATQIKQKFGSLRFRFSGFCYFCFGASQIVSAYSERVCEITGMPGSRCVGAGVKTLSRSMARELGFKIDESAKKSLVAAPKGLPYGWGRIAGALIGLCGSNPAVNPRFEELSNHLDVRSATDDPFYRGAIAGVIALSRITDRNSGEVIFRRG